jgi:hypothetical protein
MHFLLFEFVRFFQYINAAPPNCPVLQDEVERQVADQIREL